MHSDKKWTARWKEDDWFKHIKQFYGQPDKIKAKGIMMMKSNKLKLWVECITGHNN